MTQMQVAVAPVEDAPVRPSLLDRCVSPALLLALLAAWLALDQLLLWRFLGLVSNGLVVAGAALLSGLPLLACRVQLQWQGPSIRLALVAGAIAAMILLLGGEGRLFYVTTDWQVRSAVLRDMVLDPWPFAYDVAPRAEILRAPLGMYLAPALFGKLAGFRAAEFALLVQNSGLLTLLLALGSSLFTSTRTRCIALGVFLCFSGMDAIGQLLAGQPITMNADRWNLASYQSHVTTAFWAPQHALAGWAGALLFLLWRAGRIPLVGFIGPLPLLALWSPLALAGVLPFAAYAGFETLARRQLRMLDVALPLAASAIALPGLLYLATASTALGASSAPLPLHQYVAFEALEVGPYLLALWFVGRSDRFGGTTLLLVTATLLVVPYVQVGESEDFTLRASIPSLVILSLAIAELIARPLAAGERLWRNVALFALAVGSITPAFEIWRAITLPRGPEVLCSYFGVVPGGYATYTAPLDRVAPAVRPRAPAMIKPQDPPHCWNSPWPEPMLYADGKQH